MNLVKYVSVIFLVSACAIDPVATADYSGLGNSEIAKTLRYAAFTSSVGIDYAVNHLVNKPDILAMSDPRLKLEQLGFSCQPAPKKDCSYEGYARAEISSTDGTHTERFKLTIHIDARIDTNVIKINSITKRHNY